MTMPGSNHIGGPRHPRRRKNRMTCASSWAYLELFFSRKLVTNREPIAPVSSALEAAVSRCARSVLVIDLPRIAKALVSSCSHPERLHAVGDRRFARAAGKSLKRAMGIHLRDHHSVLSRPVGAYSPVSCARLCRRSRAGRPIILRFTAGCSMCTDYKAFRRTSCP